MRHLKTTFITILQTLSKNSRKKLRADYKKWVKNTQSCLITNLPDADFHHERNVNEITGMKITPPDEYGNLLVSELHTEYHKIGFLTFEKKYSIDLLKELEKLHDKFLEYARDNQEG